jgi:hypothetical protein
MLCIPDLCSAFVILEGLSRDQLFYCHKTCHLSWLCQIFSVPSQNDFGEEFSSPLRNQAKILGIL